MAAEVLLFTHFDAVACLEIVDTAAGRQAEFGRVTAQARRDGTVVELYGVHWNVRGGEWGRGAREEGGAVRRGMVYANEGDVRCVHLASHVDQVRHELGRGRGRARCNARAPPLALAYSGMASPKIRAPTPTPIRLLGRLRTHPQEMREREGRRLAWFDDSFLAPCRNWKWDSGFPREHALFPQCSPS